MVTNEYLYEHSNYTLEDAAKLLLTKKLDKILKCIDIVSVGERGKKPLITIRKEKSKDDTYVVERIAENSGELVLSYHLEIKSIGPGCINIHIVTNDNNKIFGSYIVTDQKSLVKILSNYANIKDMEKMKEVMAPYLDCYEL